MNERTDQEINLNAIIERLTTELIENPSIKRAKPRSKRVPFETVFDRVRCVLKLFELTQDKAYLEASLSYVEEAAVYSKGHTFFRFAPSMPNLSMDADTTGYGLLFCGMAEKYGVSIPEELSIRRNLAQFEELVDRSGGVQTWFDDRTHNVVDPIVNTTVMWAYQITRTKNEVSEAIRRYLNKLLEGLQPQADISHYYRNGTLYFVERMSKLGRYDSNFLTPEAQSSLQFLLPQLRPTNTLDRARLSKIASQWGNRDMAVSLNAGLETRMHTHRFWPYAAFYQQHTPSYHFGSEVITSLTAVEALKMEKEGIEKVHF